MRVLVAGASGFIGRELLAQLEAAGHEVHVLTRGAPSGRRHHWDPATGAVDVGLVADADAIIDLAGASLQRLPWTQSYKREILRSRIAATSTLVAAMRRAPRRPSTFLNASAVGYYGDRPGEELTEESSMGEGFLPKVVDRWERTASKAPDDVRVVTLRTGVVVGRGGGAFAPLELLTRLGLAGRLGSGRQHWPWISLSDEASAIVHLLTSELRGPVNLEGPEPATNERITAALAEAMDRWHPWTVPAVAIRAALGQAGSELLLADQRAVPRKLLDDSFIFRDRTIEDAVAVSWGPRATA